MIAGFKKLVIYVKLLRTGGKRSHANCFSLQTSLFLQCTAQFSTQQRSSNEQLLF